MFWRCRSVPRADLRHLVSFFRELGQCVSSSHTPAAMAHVSRVVVELRMEAHDTLFWGCRSVPRADLRHLVSFFRELGQCVSSSHTPASMAHVSLVVVKLRMEAHDTVFWGCRSVFQAGLSHLVVFFYETGQCVMAGAPDQMTIRGIEGIGTHHEMVRNLPRHLRVVVVNMRVVPTWIHIPTEPVSYTHLTLPTKA